MFPIVPLKSKARTRSRNVLLTKHLYRPNRHPARDLHRPRHRALRAEIPLSDSRAQPLQPVTQPRSLPDQRLLPRHLQRTNSEPHKPRDRLVKDQTRESQPRAARDPREERQLCPREPFRDKPSPSRPTRPSRARPENAPVHFRPPTHYRGDSARAAIAWPLRAPRHASAAVGKVNHETARRLWIAIALRILNKANERTLTPYADMMLAIPSIARAVARAKRDETPAASARRSRSRAPPRARQPEATSASIHSRADSLLLLLRLVLVFRSLSLIRDCPLRAIARSTASSSVRWSWPLLLRPSFFCSVSHSDTAFRQLRLRLPRIDRIVAACRAALLLLLLRLSFLCAQTDYLPLTLDSPALLPGLFAQAASPRSAVPLLSLLTPARQPTSWPVAAGFLCCRSSSWSNPVLLYAVAYRALVPSPRRRHQLPAGPPLRAGGDTICAPRCCTS